ncbi:MAG: hypothetical protein KAU06_08790 [Candidatus Marinimicrobia bacterium]|nr:hypothetical protein [Candidatus Neomarinimicrobiota bacterium]
MGIIEWANLKVKTQNIWDIGILKIFCTIVGIILGAYISNFVIQYVWWFVVIAILLFIWLMYRFLKVKV